MSKQPAPKKPSSAIINVIPNNYEEQPSVIDGKQRLYKDKVAAAVDELDSLGKFITIFQYVSVLVVILVLVLSRIFEGTTVSYTELKPTYEKYLELSNSDDVLNMKCTVANDTLTYNAFTTFSYEKADACTWVEADLEKARPAKTDVNYTVYTDDNGDKVEEPLTRRDLLGNISACKKLKKDATCNAIRDDCVRGHKSIERVLSNLNIANFPLKELLDDESKLVTFVNATLTQTVQSLLSGLEGPRLAVEQWAAKNMPVLYGYFGNLHSLVQGNMFQNGDRAKFIYKSVSASCTFYNIDIAGEDGSTCDFNFIADGICDEGCNNPYCLYDGGDCLNALGIYWGNSNSFYDEETGEHKYRAFSPLQQGDELFINPDYDVGEYSNNVKNALKLLKDNNGALLFDENESGVVEDDEISSENLYGYPSFNGLYHNLPNLFDGFDPNATCGDPSKWYEFYELDRPNSWVSNLEDMQDFVFETVLKDEVYPVLGSPAGVTVPSNFIPVQNTDVFSCDAMSQSENLPGVKGSSTANIKEWVDYIYTVFAYFKVKCAAGATPSAWSTDCFKIDELIEEGDYDDTRYQDVKIPHALLTENFDIVRILSELEYAYLGSAARNNSGSVKQLLLDAGIKRDAKGYKVEATVDFETYYKASDVSQCTYSRKIGANPATVVTVILGLIGGVTTAVSFLALVVYNIFRRKVTKKYKKEISVEEDSSAI
jgi:hypothetical protein